MTMGDLGSINSSSFQKIVVGILTLAVVAMATATIDHAQRLAVLEAGPRGGEIITRLVTIETRLAVIMQRMDDDRAARRGDSR